MLKILVILFRESIEIALMLSTIFAATRNLPNAKTLILIGVILGAILSLILAIFTNNIAQAFEGFGSEIFNIIIISASIIMVAWTVVWMRKRSSEYKNDLKILNEKATQGKIITYSLPLLIATLMFREGAEIILFTYSVLTIEQVSLTQFITATILGFGGGTIIGIALYLGLTRSSSRIIFKLTSWLLIFIAANLASQLANLLNSIGLFSSLEFTAWNSSNLMNDQSYYGKIANIIVGYQARPSMLQVILYFFTIFSITFSNKYNK